MQQKNTPPYWSEVVILKQNYVFVMLTDFTTNKMRAASSQQDGSMFMMNFIGKGAALFLDIPG